MKVQKTISRRHQCTLGNQLETYERKWYQDNMNIGKRMEWSHRYDKKSIALTF